MTVRTILLILLALLGLLLIAFFCIPQKAEQIEADILQRSTQSVADAGLQTVQVSADGQTVLLQGSVADMAAREQAEQLVASLEGVSHVDNQLEVNPDGLPMPLAEAADETITLEVAAEKITLTGTVPDAETKSRINDIAEAKFGEGNVTNNLGISAIASATVSNIVAERLVGSLKDMHNGKAVISSSNLSIAGEVDTEEQRDNLRQSVSEGLPAPYLPVYSVSISKEQNQMAASQCQSRFSALLEKEKVRFAVNQALINKPSHALLDKLAKVAADCPNVKIEISGHTDSSGSAEYNKALSQRRAEAVMDYLTGKKVAKTRLTAKGYGEAKPLVSNKTVKGMAQNRRIEFTVK